MTEVLYNPKIKPEHLARKAIVYLRQSSDKQVRQNKESQLLQYAVADRVRALGWPQVDIINRAPRKIDFVANRGLSWSERLRIGTRTNRNHSTTILWRAIGSGYFSRCPIVTWGAIGFQGVLPKRCGNSTMSVCNL